MANLTNGSLTFPDNLRPALDRLIKRAKIDGANVSPFDWCGDDERNDATIVQQGLLQLGVEVDLKTAYAVWSLYSEDCAAGWMVGPDTPDAAIGSITNLCHDIADGTDYAGFSASDNGEESST